MLIIYKNTLKHTVRFRTGYKRISASRFFMIRSKKTTPRRR